MCAMKADSIRTIEEKLERLEAQMNAPETYADPALFARLARERKALLPAAEAARRVQALEADVAAAQELADEFISRIRQGQQRRAAI